MAEQFGCCSKYIECSDQGKCLYRDDPEFDGCGYRRNLESGRIFYGKNVKQHKSVTQTYKNNYKIYLTCYNQPFAVLTRNKVGLSYQLKVEQFEKVENLFRNLDIPYVTEIDLRDYKEIEPDEEIVLYDSRVVISIGNDQFNILNFNSLLISEKTADGIRRAFEAKGVPARTELYGRSNKVDIPRRANLTEIRAIVVGDIPKSEPEPEPEKEIIFEQSNIFEMLNTG